MAGIAAAFDPSTIADAKLHAGADSGFPCMLHGSVTLLLDKGDFYLQDDSGGVRVVSDPDVLHPGDRLEVEGWMYLADTGEFQVRARKLWRVAEGAPLGPRLVALEGARAGNYQGQLIAVRGTVLNVDFGSSFDTLSIQSGRNSLRAFAPANPHGVSIFEQVYPGMQVAVSGISVPQTVDPELDGYQIRVNGTSGLVISPRPGASPLAGEAGQALAIGAILGAGLGIWTMSRRQRRKRSASQASSMDARVLASES